MERKVSEKKLSLRKAPAPHPYLGLLSPGRGAKLVFQAKDHAERMWVLVTETLSPTRFAGQLWNEPRPGFPIKQTDRVEFDVDEVWDVVPSFAGVEAFPKRADTVAPRCHDCADTRAEERRKRLKRRKRGF